MKNKNKLKFVIQVEYLVHQVLIQHMIKGLIINVLNNVLMMKTIDIT